MYLNKIVIKKKKTDTRSKIQGLTKIMKLDTYSILLKLIFGFLSAVCRLCC